MFHSSKLRFRFRGEKNLKSDTDVLKDVPNYLPGLMRAEKLYKKAKGLGYEEKSIDEMYAEVSDLLSQMKAEQDFDKAEKFYGKILFNLTAIGKSRDFTAETAISDESNRFIERFSQKEGKI